MTHQLRYITLLLAVFATACSVGEPATERPYTAEERSLSCAELADRKAAEQHAAETDALDDRAGGIRGSSALARDFATMDAETRRRMVYEECRKLRGLDAGPTPKPEESQ